MSARASAIRISSAAALLAAAGFAGCDNLEVHIFSAWLYDAERDCLEAPAAVDVIEGPEPAPCTRLRCWESPSGQIYVTAYACDAPPDYEERTDDPVGPCPAAMAAYEREGHSLCPAASDDEG